MVTLDQIQSYFRQLAAYRLMARESSEFKATPIEAGLVLIDIDSGITQTVALTPEDERAFEVQLDTLLRFVEQRRSSLERLAGLEFQPAFLQPRPGQESIQQELDEAGRQSRLVFFEAPTGYGKTGCGTG